MSDSKSSSRTQPIRTKVRPLKRTAASGGNRRARREEIRKELQAIFIAEGFRNLTIDKLARRLGCSNRTLYSIAPSKEEMFLGILSEGIEKALKEGLEGAMSHEDPVARIEAYLLPGVTASRALSAQFIQDVQTYLPARQLLENYRKERMRFLEGIIASGVKSGHFRKIHPHLVAETLLSAVHRFEQLSADGQAELSFDEAVAELYDLLLHGLVLDPRAS
ncbi:MAG: TetR/AcrR family transcriptional regulator [Pseudomonadota bacterium]